jgi:REP element-mobilizing transposase RayT
MKRRCWEHDYCAPCFYMVTIVTEPRRNCLSTVAHVEAGAAPTTEPVVTLSPMGEIIQDVWRQAAVKGVKMCECVVMPDHFHCIVRVTEQLERHVGHTVKAFKRVCVNECRSKGLLLPPNHSKGLLPPPNPGPAAGPSTLWETGYQDTILLRRGQLKRMSNYISDNPRRLAMKRANPDLFTVVANLHVTPQYSLPAIGNQFLLDRPVKRQVQVSRCITPDALASLKEELLYAATHGAVLVSPCISPGEKEIVHAALDAGLPLIVLLENGFKPHYKPPGQYFDACANGQLLMLAPFPHHREKRVIAREQCLELNRWAARVADQGQ